MKNCCAARQLAQLGLQNPTGLGQHQGGAPNCNAAASRPDFFILHSSFCISFFRGRGRQAMHLLCKQVDVGALPTDSTSLRSKRRESEAAAPKRSEGGPLA